MKNTMEKMLWVVSAPSGTGKTSLNRRLMDEFPGIVKATTHTTRAPRGQEQNGKDYHFVPVAEFERLLNDSLMLEHANVFGNLYGTSLGEVDRLQRLGKIIILEVDVQGWQSVSRLKKDARSIFIFPPSMKDLWERLAGRGTDDLKTRLRRLAAAKKEIEASRLFHFFVINDDFDAAYDDLRSLVTGAAEQARLDHAAGLQHAERLIREFETADWIAAMRKNFPEVTEG